MLTPMVVLFFSIAYIALLFFVAIQGDRRSAPKRWQPVIYTLSISTVATSWTFYGAIEQFSTTGWWISPLHVGIIATFLIGWRFLQRMVDLARKENSTTIADFISARYGHSRTVAVLVSVISLVGITPYIALQYKAVSASFDILTRSSSIASDVDLPLITALLMALFAIMFGTRSIDTSEKHHGLMHTLAFEGIFKLVMLLGVGLYVVFSLFQGPIDLLSQGLAVPEIRATLVQSGSSYVYIAHFILGMTILFTLPRQFHVAVVENSGPEDLKMARWMFPIYLILINIMVQPIAIAGKLMLGLDNPDPAYVSLLLPLQQGMEWLTLLVYLGGISAATSMVIIATVTLSTMTTNELMLPIAFRLKLLSSNSQHVNTLILWLRRFVILAISLGAYGYFKNFTSTGILISIGMPAMVAVFQFTPAIVLGLGWDAMNRKGAILGLSVGFFMWFYTLVFPVIITSGMLPADWINGPMGLSWLAPQGLFGMHFMDQSVHGMFWSISANIVALILGSLYYQESLTDRVQANRFVNDNPSYSKRPPIKTDEVALQDLRVMLNRLLGRNKTRELLKAYRLPYTGKIVNGVASESLMLQSERMLGSVIGAGAARIILNSLTMPRPDVVDNLNSLVEEASQVSQFGRDLLNSAVQSLSQGISIIDRDLNIVAWNRQFGDLFGFPKKLLAVGNPIEGLIRHNVERGILGPGDPDTLVERRLAHLRSGTPHKNERILAPDHYLEVVGHPMPGGNYITTYTDITEQKAYERQLKQNNESLELVVQERTNNLESLNKALVKANENKSHYLTAVGHDLVQPLNAAELFSASLNELLRSQHADEKLLSLSENMQRSLESAGSLLSGLLEFSKLDADLIKPESRTFSLKLWIEGLLPEYELFADQKNLRFRVKLQDMWVEGDPVLLQRILQNLLTNAFRYTKTGGVLLGLRKVRGQLSMEVWDTGVGVHIDHQIDIFREFYRLSQDRKHADGGLGLGLAIVNRLCNLQGYQITMRSVLGRGTVFKVLIPIGNQPLFAQLSQDIDGAATPALGRRPLILCIDNEPYILRGMYELLSPWGYDVLTASDEAEARAILTNGAPDLVLVDYHLDHGVTGIQVVTSLRVYWGVNVPGAVVTANYSQEVSDEAKRLSLQVLKKPIRPLALRSTIDSLLKNSPAGREGFQ